MAKNGNSNNNGRGGNRGGGRGGRSGGRGGNGGGRSGGNQQSGNRQSGNGGGRRDNSQQTSQLTMAFLQMYRLDKVAQTVSDLRARTNEFGVVPSASREVVASALRMLGATQVFCPKESIFLVPIAPPAAQQMQTITAAAASSGPSQTYTVLSSSIGMAPGLVSSRPPPRGVIGVVKRPSGLFWVVASHADNAPESRHSWAPTADESRIYVGELTQMDHKFTGTISFTGPDGRFASEDCGVAVHVELNAALNGNVQALVRCAHMLAGATFVAPPAGALSNGKPTRDALISFLSWLSTASKVVAPAAINGEQKMTWA